MVSFNKDAISQARTFECHEPWSIQLANISRDLQVYKQIVLFSVLSCTYSNYCRLYVLYNIDLQNLIEMDSKIFILIYKSIIYVRHALVTRFLFLEKVRVWKSQN